MHIKVRVRTNAKKELVEAGEKEVLYIRTRAKAEQGKANIRVREIVADYYGVPPRSVRIIKGHKSPNKTLSVQMENDV